MRRPLLRNALVLTSSWRAVMAAGPRSKGLRSPMSSSAPVWYDKRVMCLCVSTGCLMLGHGVAAPLIPMLSSSLGASAATTGLALSAFGLSRLFLNVPIGALADTWGRKRVLVGGAILNGGGMFLSALAPDINTFVFTRLIAGAGNAAYLGCAQVYLTDISASSSRARVLGANHAALLAGVSLGPALGGICADAFGLRAPFLLVGSLSTASALASHLLLLEDTKVSTAMTEKNTIKGHSTTAQKVSVALLRDPRFLSLGFAHFSSFALRQGGRNLVLALVATTHFGYSASDLGYLFGLMALTDLGLLPISSMLSDKWTDRRFVAVPSLALSALSLTGLASVISQSSPSHELFLATIAFWSLSTGILGPALPAFASDIAPEAHRGLAIAVFRSFGDLGFVIAPLALGAIVDYGGPAPAALSLASFVALSAISFARFGTPPLDLKRAPQTPSYSSSKER